MGSSCIIHVCASMWMVFDVHMHVKSPWGLVFAGILGSGAHENWMQPWAEVCEFASTDTVSCTAHSLRGTCVLGYKWPGVAGAVPMSGFYPVQLSEMGFGTELTFLKASV